MTKEAQTRWTNNSSNIDLIYLDSEIVGYALYQFRDDEVYLRHYFIKSEHRNKGYGQQGIQLLKEKRFKQIGTVTLDVLNHNTMGMSFWKKVGFMPYSTTMKMMGDMSTDE